MKKLLSILAGVLLFAFGFGIIVIADHQGWLKSQTIESDCKHGLASNECPFCEKSVIEEKGECPEHGVPEAFCTRCNPALVQAFKVEGDWCAGHSVPESQCTICNPALLKKRENTSIPEKQANTVRFSSKSDLPRNLRPPTQACDKETLPVEFFTPDIAVNTGLKFSKVEQRPVTLTRSCNAEVTYAGNLYAHLSSRAQGVVKQVLKDLGDHVKSGEILAVLDSSDLGTAKAEYLQSQAMVSLWKRNHDREQKLMGKGVATQRDVLEAETRLIESRISLSRTSQRLRNLGLTDVEITRIAETKETASYLSLAAPFDGTIVKRTAVIGEVVSTSKTLFAIADTSSMWVILDVYEDDIHNFRVGMPVTVETDGNHGKRFEGRITWISSYVDNRTRTLKARVEISNPDGLLKAGMFAKAIVNYFDHDAAIIVPKTAVQWEGCCNVVFVKKSDTLFEPRKVNLSYETRDFFIVDAGLAPGEQVVTTGSFLLKTEILKGSIGAGCCEIQPGKS